MSELSLAQRLKDGEGLISDAEFILGKNSYGEEICGLPAGRVALAVETYRAGGDGCKAARTLGSLSEFFGSKKAAKEYVRRIVECRKKVHP